MSQVKIQLRQPPNVDFLEGFPGIPGDPPDRPPAALRGAVEVRVLGDSAVKAKWVKIELRKIETLLQNQGGPYAEVIGQGPVVWQATGEFEALKAQDFPFYIRIPENLPPSIALEKGAGIRYEMVASLCTKGKKGLFRRDASPIYSASVPIVIDKHELHTAWPVYHKIQNSQRSNDGLTLFVTRDASCYGPGDRVSARAELRSSRASPCILRAYEFTLREHVTFRPDPSYGATAGTKATGGPPTPVQFRHNVIAEQKIPMSKTIYEGVSHITELACLVPFSHRTTSTSGRLIEVTFTLCVKAVMESAQSVEVMEPVLMANWLRDASAVALQKIGPVSHLGVEKPQAQTPEVPYYATPPTNGAPPPIGGLSSPPAPSSHRSLSDRSDRKRYPGVDLPPEDAASPPSPPYTPPVQGSPFASQQNASLPGVSSKGMNEFGYRSNLPGGGPSGTGTMGNNSNNSLLTSALTNSANANSRQSASVNGSVSASASARGGPGSSPNGSRRERTLTVINVDPDSSGAYMNAEEEKRRLNESFNQQSSSTNTTTTDPVRPPGAARSVSANASQPIPSGSGGGGAGQGRKPPWPSSEDEKRKLFERAQAQARRTQEQARRAAGMPAESLSRQESSASEASNMPSSSGSHTSSSTAATTINITPPSTANTPTPGNAPIIKSASAKAGSSSDAWLGAGEEKERLFRAAQRRARETQARVASPSNGPRDRSGSVNSQNARQPAARPTSVFKMANPDPVDEDGVPAMPVPVSQATLAPPQPTPAPAERTPSPNSAAAAAALYASAMSSRAQTGIQQSSSSQQPPQQSSSQRMPSPPSTVPSGTTPKTHASAEDEKAQLARYFEAKKAVQRSQVDMDGTPIVSGSPPFSPPQPVTTSPSSATSSPMASQSMPAQVVSSPGPSTYVPADAPPQRTVTPSTSARQYSDGARDSVAPSRAVSYTATPPDEVPMTEKERMRLFLEAQDRAARFQQESLGGGSSSYPNAYGAPPYDPPPPTNNAPPSFDGPSTRPPSAIEEKARLRSSSAQNMRMPVASRASMQQIPQSGTPPPGTYTPSLRQRSSDDGFSPYAGRTTYDTYEAPREPTPPPPPLPPRPPLEYIQEGLQENEDDEEVQEQREPRSWDQARSSTLHHSLSFRPVSPFDMGILSPGQGQNQAPSGYQSPASNYQSPSSYQQPSGYQQPYYR